MKRILLLVVTLGLLIPSTFVYGETFTNNTSVAATHNAPKEIIIEFPTDESVEGSENFIIRTKALTINPKDEDIFDFPSIAWSTYGELRKMLVQEYGVSEEEMATYTNQQLFNAFILFTRYNSDIIGMDLGTYVAVLRDLFKLKTLDWNVVEKQLAFSPESYDSFSDMLPHVRELSDYLKALYPENGNRFNFKYMTPLELHSLLNKAIDLNLDSEECQIYGKFELLKFALATETTPEDTNNLSPQEKNALTPLTSKIKETTEKKESRPDPREKATFSHIAAGFAVLVLVTILFSREKTS